MSFEVFFFNRVMSWATLRQPSVAQVISTLCLTVNLNSTQLLKL